MRFPKLYSSIIALTLGGIASACGPSAADATPTVNPDMIRTEAVATFAADLTLTALAMPTDTATPTETPTATATATAEASSTPNLLATSASLPTSSCFGMAYVADVTIPDNTSMTPGQSFTKTWRVRNNGSCTWEVGFKLNFIGGNAMGASSVALTKAVAPGAEAEISVPMTAPTASGSARGNWRMSTATGTYFGDEIYVLIVVSGSTATAPAASATPTSTFTATPVETPLP
jgi:hypothetical protein